MNLKTALITGATRGIGWEFSKTLAREKFTLHLLGRTEISDSQKEQLVAAGAQEVIGHQCDLNNRDQAERFFDTAAKLSIDLLFNNAGLLTGGPIETQSFHEISAVNHLNLTIPMQLTRAIVPGMLKAGRGCIINNASVSGVMNLPAASTYAATKAGLIAFSRSLQAEFHNTPLQCLTLITPGVKTQMYDEIDDKYGDYLDIPTTSIPAEEYAEKIWKAVVEKRNELRPPGMVGAYVRFAQTFPGLFGKLTSRAFHR